MDANVLQEVKTLIEKQGEAFKTLKDENEKRFTAIEEKSMSAVQQEKVDKISGTILSIQERMQSIRTGEASMDSFKTELEGLKSDVEELAGIEKKAEDKTTQLIQEEKKALQKRIDFLEAKMNRLPAGDSKEEKSEEYKSFFKLVRAGLDMNNVPEEERKGLSVDREEYGGYLAPPEFVNEMIKVATEISPVRPLVTVRATGQNSMRFPKRKSIITATRVVEGGTKSEQTGYKYGREEITLPEMYSEALVTTHELEDALFAIEDDLREQFGLAFGVLEGNEFINGDGIGELEGLLQNPDIAEVNSGDASSLKVPGLTDLMTSIKTAYYPRAKFIFNLQTLGKLLLLQDGAGQYIWMPNMQMITSELGTIMGKPYTLFQDCPDVAADAYPIFYGDFKSGYKLGDRRAFNIQRLIEKYAGTGQIGFLATKRTGGQVVLAEAIKKHKVSA